MTSPEKTKPEKLTPRQSGEFIVDNAKHLRVIPAGIKRLTQEVIAGMKDGKIGITNFSQHELHPKQTDSYAIEWIFLVDTLNFCFWTPANYKKYKVNGYTGYFALCAAINKAIDNGINITSAEYYSALERHVAEIIFASDNDGPEIPLLQERVNCMHEVGKRLISKWNGKFANVVLAAKKSAVRLLQLIIEEFPCFRDEANYEGKRVTLYKRAQILIGDIWSCYHGAGLGEFGDLDKITMFADYRIPQVLVHFGCMEYNEDLMNTLKKDAILKNGDRFEVEIRGASIFIVEKVKEAVFKELLEKYPEIPRANVNAILIDHFLWDYRRAHADDLEHIPFHKVYSVYY